MLRTLRRILGLDRPAAVPPRRPVRPCLEALEDRWLPSACCNLGSAVVPPPAVSTGLVQPPTTTPPTVNQLPTITLPGGTPNAPSSPYGNPPPTSFLFTPLNSAVPLAMHIHPHLSIFINGQEQVIPADIGISSTGATLPVHTHDTSGWLHVESPVAYDFQLQDFFAIWGQSFDAQDILGYHTDATQQVTVTMTVNGQPSTAFGSLVLHDGDNIVINAVVADV
jgi:hypothetical protein